MTQDKYEGIIIPNSISVGAKGSFALRETYDKVFPDVVESYDFNSIDHLLYGRIDPDGDVIHANEFYLKELKTPKSENIFCFNFVADAFMDFKNSMKSQYGYRLKPDNFFTTDWDAEKAWESPHSFYDKRMSDVIQVYIKGNLFLKNNKDRVKNIDDFLEIFFNDFYQSTNGTLPLTKSGIIRSKYYNPADTGLCIEIASDSIALDYVKFNKFIKSPNFEIYLLNAAKHGFMVDKNAPWRLIANLKSLSMQKYMLKYDITEALLFSRYFIKTHKYDIQNLKLYMKQFYDTFLSVSPNYSEEYPIINPSECLKYEDTKRVLVPREFANSQEYNSKYDDFFWLKAYFKLKLSERGIGMSSVLLTKEIERMQQIYYLPLEKLDFETTLEYINKRIKQLDN